MLKTLAFTSAAILSLAATQSQAALILTFDESAYSTNVPATGASGVVTMTFTDGANAGEVDLSVLVENTTDSTTFGAGADESKLTGFGFDLFGAGTSVIAGSFGGGSFLDTLLTPGSLSPFGSFDVAAADNSNLGGGNANGALPEGMSDTFTLTFGTSLSAYDLETEFFDGFLAATLTNQTGEEAAAALRFQQVNGDNIVGASDKLTRPFVFRDNEINEVPLPAAGWMLLAGIGGLAAARRRKKA